MADIQDKGSNGISGIFRKLGTGEKEQESVQPLRIQKNHKNPADYFKNGIYAFKKKSYFKTGMD